MGKLCSALLSTSPLDQARPGTLSQIDWPLVASTFMGRHLKKLPDEIHYYIYLKGNANIHSFLSASYKKLRIRKHCASLSNRYIVSSFSTTLPFSCWLPESLESNLLLHWNNIGPYCLCIRYSFSSGLNHIPYIFSGS